MTIRHNFSNLMEAVRQAAVQPFIAEHIFANKDKIAKALQDNKSYSFNSPTGETIEIQWDGDV